MQPLAQPAIMLPTRLGRYELLAKIAEGGMASVYLGRLSGPMGFQRPVAIKLMRPEFVQSEDFVKMFLDEARLVARLSHPNIVQLLELGQDEGPIGSMHGGFFIVMECLQGESLLDTWYACQDRRLMMPYDVVAWVGARAAEGLHHAHELKDPMTGVSERIVHRDVNPGNIFLTYDGQVKVIDFGVAKALNRLSGSTSIGTLKGKVAYMAPEQARTSNVDRRSDVFSLGITLWELSTDRRLFKRKNDVDTLMAIGDAPIPDPTTAIPDYPRELWHVLQRALQRNPDQRYQSALEMSRDLDRVAQTLGRAVDATVVAEVMNYLFYEQRNRFIEWLKHASAGESSEVLRSVDPKKGRMDLMQSVDAVPLSRRSGSELPIRASSPKLPQPEGSFDHPTVALANPEEALKQLARPISQPPPPVMPMTPVPPMPVPQQVPMYVPMPHQPEVPTVNTPKSNLSNIIFMLILVSVVLAISGYFLYARFHQAPPPPQPTIATTTAPKPTATPSASETAAPTTSSSAPPVIEDAAAASATASASSSAPPVVRPPPSIDDLLRSRR